MDKNVVQLQLPFDKQSALSTEERLAVLENRLASVEGLLDMMTNPNGAPVGADRQAKKSEIKKRRTYRDSEIAIALGLVKNMGMQAKKVAVVTGIPGYTISGWSCGKTSGGSVPPASFSECVAFLKEKEAEIGRSGI